MKPKSLHAQMIAMIAATIALCWVGALALLFAYLAHNKTSTWDDKLKTIAIRLLTTIPADADLTVTGPALRLRNPALERSEKLAFQVWINRRQLAVPSPGAPATPLRPDFEDGPATTEIAGQRWRVYSVSDADGRVHVQVGNPHSVVDAEIRNDALTGLVRTSLVLLVVGALMWMVVHTSLKQVVALEAAMRGRRKFDLTPLSPDALPRELHPLVASFNHLLLQLAESIEGERRFIGDAAHELRTPLAALQAQAQIALRANTVADKDLALTKLLRVAQSSSRLSEQLLDLARLNAGANAPQHTPEDLGDLVLHVARDFDTHALQHERSLLLEIGRCTIRCNVDEIGILLRNLIDNALRYTSKGGRVRVGCGYQRDADPGQAPKAYLDVADDGPGVPPPERQAIFERFHRAAGTSARGSGIGLSLVAGIAQSHHATIETGNGLDGRGFAVRIVFPAATAGADVQNP
ncbi:MULTISPECIES: sensor histidine kinase [unclassified Variovorax]|uniref:sensor histidine kinase n=1 Tax=unclassified Variovorax TaxID=663243 RepID=UPI000D1317E5|nr:MULTISPECIES: ATP-binding protein [unclassified Variovorax]AVQ81892.1 two-component sensor histidine kinase [Variovorax sp. PMC12]